MTTESALAKIMWIMGQTTSLQEMKTMFYTPVANDILSILKDGKASFAPVFQKATACDVLSSAEFACRRYIRTDADKATAQAMLGNVTDLGGAYITDKPLTEAEFDALLQKLGCASALRVL